MNYDYLFSSMTKKQEPIRFEDKREKKNVFRSWQESTAISECVAEAMQLHIRAAIYDAGLIDPEHIHGSFADFIKRQIAVNSFSIRIVETEHITKEVQARRHRKKCINKKWRKRYGVVHVTDPNDALLYQDPMGTVVLYVHPKMSERLKVEILEELKHKQLPGISGQFK